MFLVITPWPWLAVAISFVSLIITITTYTNFAKNDFVKKQIDLVIKAVEMIHNSPFEFNLTKYSADGTSTASIYKLTLFEVNEFKRIQSESLTPFNDSPILFHHSCNQLMEMKSLIDNPFLPKSIADELEKFYCTPPLSPIFSNAVQGQKIIVIKSKVFENNEFENQNIQPVPILKQPSGFSYKSVENFITCSVLLELSIRSWLEKYNVQEINIRRDFKNI